MPWYPVPAALLAQLVEHLHGKEGVDGSSPSEGFKNIPANSHFECLSWRNGTVVVDELDGGHLVRKPCKSPIAVA